MASWSKYGVRSKSLAYEGRASNQLFTSAELEGLVPLRYSSSLTGLTRKCKLEWNEGSPYWGLLTASD